MKIFLSIILVILLVAITFSLVYLGHLLRFKETAELSTLTHWFNSPAKTKFLNTKLCIQWGIMKA